MLLPESARQRLAEPLRDPRRFWPQVKTSHTVPIEQWPWRQHSDALTGALDGLAEKTTEQLDRSYVAVQEWVEQVLNAGQLVLSHLLAMEPFVPFDGAEASAIISLVKELLHNAADAIEQNTRMGSFREPVHEAATRWAELERKCESDSAIQVAFGMDLPPHDDYGEFRADWVLQHYAYRSAELLAHVVPHLVSLGVPHVDDVLAGVSIVGWVLDCDDPVGAYVAMDMFLNRYFSADPNTARQVRAHLEKSESALRRTAHTTRRSRAAAFAASDDTEARALALVDMYKRVIEGPFRQFSWALHCLRNNKWEPTVTLGPLRDRLVADGGDLATMVRQIVLPDLRNSETHETLTWDGFAEEFVTESGRIPPIRVAGAASLAEAFVRGCEAAFLAVRTLDTRPDEISLPSVDERGRLASWRRVHAFFGTNRLRVTEAQLNTQHAKIGVEQLRYTDINPCFQALLLAHRLLPQTESFSVRVAGMPIIEVSAVALDATMPAWEYAISAVDQMPLAAFLPANLDARSRIEPIDVAIRSVAWIAVDDVLSALDGSPEDWNDDERILLAARLRIVEIAVEQTTRQLAAPSIRLASVLASAANLRQWVVDMAPVGSSVAERLLVVAQLRTQWTRWGPVPRHPLIPDEPAPDRAEPPPGLANSPDTFRYRTL
ncbi:MAG: hypothetical protein JWN95_1412 [Frankiales bacterium]|nr:hypothetical protein [Frankiales bacterium]